MTLFIQPLPPFSHGSPVSSSPFLGLSPLPLDESLPVSLPGSLFFFAEPPSDVHSFSSTRLGLPSDLQAGAFLGGSLWPGSSPESPDESSAASSAESSAELTLSLSLSALSLSDVLLPLSLSDALSPLSLSDDLPPPLPDF